MNTLIDNICGENCYVAFLDILGFKEKIMNNFDTIDVARIFINLKNKRKECLKKCNFNEEYDQAVADTIFRIMSDSIVISTPTRFPDSLNIVAEMCMLIQSYLLMNNHILLRGSIVKGDFFCDNEIMFGSGLVNAYINEGRAKYPRITIAKELVDEYVDRVGTSRITYITDFLLKDADAVYFINCFIENSDLGKWVNGELAKEQIYGGVREKYLWLDRWISMSKTEIEQHYVEKDYKYLFKI